MPTTRTPWRPNSLLTYLQTTRAGHVAPAGFPVAGRQRRRQCWPPTPRCAGARWRHSTRADCGTATDALALWATLTRQLRMLAVVDVSGSMAKTVPGTGQTRLQLTAAACEKAMALFGEPAAMGLWTFTTTRDAADRLARVIDPVLPIAELGSAEPGGGTHGQRMVAAYGALTDKAGSRNGLYDALLAAYQAVLKGWDSGAGEHGGGVHRRQGRQSQQHELRPADREAAGRGRPGAAGAGLRGRARPGRGPDRC